MSVKQYPDSSLKDQVRDQNSQFSIFDMLKKEIDSALSQKRT